MVHQTMNTNKASATPASSNRIHMPDTPRKNFYTTRDSTACNAAPGEALHQRDGSRVHGLVATLLVLLAACTTTPPTPPTPPAPTPAVATRPTAQLTPVTYADLPGWQDDDIEAAWPALLRSCRALRNRPAWQKACAGVNDIAALDRSVQRAFIEAHFAPQRLTESGDSGDRSGAAGLITGYYEPLLRGSRTPRPPYTTPLYSVPDDLLTIDLASVYPQLAGMRLRGRLAGNKVLPYPSRGEIERGQLLKGKELVWVDSPIEAFFLQVQGSGRVELDATDAPDGRRETLRLGYADQNGHPYKSIGRWLVDQGELPLDQVSMQSISGWAAAHPERLSELLDSNPSYVFFRASPVTDPAVGPTGALGVPLTPQRSIAVDPSAIPLGTPVFLEMSEPGTGRLLRRLVVAQDTGGAIRGVLRADYFWGFGAAAGELAGRTRQQGRFWVLLPR